MFHSSYIEISESALKNNLDYLRNRFGGDVIFSSVIKGNAYGHGIENILPLAEKYGVNHFSVFSANEALKALKYRTNGSEIMIMGMIDNEQVEWAVENGISFYVFEKDRLNSAIENAKRLKTKAKIHVELETGMYRTGFEESELDEINEIIKKNTEFLSVEGICTHFAGAESISNYLRVKNQMKLYSRMVRKIQKSGLIFKKCHVACSAAAIRYKRTLMDMVRIGIAQYGMWPNRETFMHDVSEQEGDEYAVDPLNRVISWKTNVMSLKEIPANRFVGYGTSYLTNTKTTIATVPVGYVHGFNRNLSNLGKVMIHGKHVPVIGLVNMNMMVVDVTNLENVQKGDEVVIIGNQDGNELSVSSFSELTNYLNYETLARLPEVIPRFVVD